MISECAMDPGFSVLVSRGRLSEKPTHYRFCFMRAGMKETRSRDPEARFPAWTETTDQLWRLRDERTGTLVLVKEYRGDVPLNWTDGGSHVFADAHAEVDEKGIAWLSEEPFDG